MLDPDFVPDEEEDADFVPDEEEDEVDPDFVPDEEGDDKGKGEEDDKGKGDEDDADGAALENAGDNRDAACEIKKKGGEKQ